MRALAVAVSVLLLAGSGCFARQWYAKETLTRRYSVSTCTVTGKERVRTDGSSSSRSQGAVQVDYRYSVGGRSYTGRDKSSWTPDFAAVGRFYDQIEVGAGYRCWYDPADPRDSVMYPTSDTFVAGLGTVMLLVGAGLVFFVSRQLES